MPSLSNIGRLKLEMMIRQDEGLKQHIYTDTTGNRTIGYGHNLDANGISLEVAELILKNDIDNVIIDLTKNLPVYNEIDDTRKVALLDIAFNIGVTGLMQFRTFLGLIEQGKFQNAANDLLNTLWAKQVPNRAARIAHVIETGIL